MNCEQPKYTAEEILASTEAHAVHWENEARYSPPDVAFHCRDYAQHLRTIAECLRIDMLEKDVFNEGETPCMRFAFDWPAVSPSANSFEHVRYIFVRVGLRSSAAAGNNAATKPQSQARWMVASPLCQV